MSSELLSILEFMEKEKGISRADMISAISNSIRNAAQKGLHAGQELRVEIDPKTGNMKAWSLLTATDSVGDSEKEIHIENARMREGSWITTLGVDLQGKVLGILGLGRLGRKMAQVGQAFDMECIAWSANLTAEDAARHGVKRVEKDDLFREADFLTIHYKLGERSRGLVGARELGLMKTTAYLINTSRGPIVDTDALIAALEAGQIAGAGVDVYDDEPLAPDAPIRRAPNTVLTPHLGYVTDGVYTAFYGQMVESIEAWLAGNPVRVLT